MGYYTNYNLTVTGLEDSEKAEFFEFKLRKISEYSGWIFEHYPLDGDCGISASLYEVKWYGWKSDLESISKQFPNAVITVDGTGEEAGDIWRAKVQNGVTKHAKATITFPELD